ncbi:adenylate/guanylate cyclase domain-containing protein [Segatella copri]|uniref:Guanylate cyclase domain-containing protein n=1 Tax=Segatella copri TaxID=165179 RepID=A0AAW5I0K7_9BACT|nr:adenylate/guanylate cyclase domain-containing protein [Segatella copri]MCF0067525.1 hypothetical protein [Segatella copri]MCP9458852.1 hypothetical protein [Segatella copri]MCP9501718.1 hypothetical protein [Segatella copri]MCP9504583.1 hypothetical protein [Segatella copri]MCP9507703.1 hypothetical protein [Segatella copri]
MEVKTSYTYNFEDSCKRIDDMLATSGDFEETVDIKKRVNLTYDNGYYVNCYALFVDIRDSSSLPSVHQKRVLAKLYRSYISEVTAIMQSNTNCKEVNIIGDCVSGIFTCSSKDDVMEPFSAAYTINGIVQVLNLKASKKGYHPIKIGIGIAKGKALMVQAGYRGSGLNDVIWMGDVVNFACHLCGSANKNGNGVMNVSAEVYTDLAGMLGYQNKPYQEMLNKPYDKNYYTGNIILHSIEEWLDENR